MRAGSSEGGELRHSRYLFWGLAAGYLMGVRAAAAVGAVFGVASMWKASAYYVEAGDAVFSPVVSGRPLHALLVYSFMGGAVPGTGFWPREYGQ